MSATCLKMLYSCLFYFESLLEDEQRTSVGELVDGLYRQNRPSFLPAQIPKIKHHHMFRSFKLTNSTRLGGYLHAGEFSHSTGQNET